MQIAVLTSVWEGIRKSTSGRVFCRKFFLFFHNIISKFMDDIIVVKFGTSSLFPENLSLRELAAKRENEFESATRQIAEIRKKGRRVIVITSGAIYVGEEYCREKKIEGLVHTQFAAVGAHLLMDRWAKAFERFNIPVAQILVTYANLNDPDERKSVAGNVLKLLAAGVVPIINENDPVSAEEVELLKKKIGDNDVLTSMVAPLIGARRVLILTDQEYIFEFEPFPEGPQPFKYLEIDCNAVPQHLLDASVGEDSRGGIPSKVGAAARCASFGMEVLVARFYANRDTIIQFDIGNARGTKLGHQTVTKPAHMTLA